MFKRIFIENEVKDLLVTKRILDHFTSIPKTIIDDIDNYFGRVKKPYLQKRNNLNLFLGRKKGTLVKKTPDAYGVNTGEHYYFIHAYNCIYECEFCYLQGYFNSPDIVLFLNHNEIIEEMRKISFNKKEVWFHAGEFSDSLALSSITKEWTLYWDFFKQNPNANLELRSKSANIKNLLELEPLKNTIISFSLSDNESINNFDHKTASLKMRLSAIKKLVDKGFYIGLHLDPIIYSSDYEKKYQDLYEEIIKVLPNQQLKYISIGVVRFTKDSYRQLELNYPESKIFTQPLQKSFDGKVRYSRPLRTTILEKVRSIFLKSYDNEKIYLCME